MGVASCGPGVACNVTRVADAGQTVRLAVVVPTRNRAALAINALRSVLAQNLPEVRVMVSDNSTAPEEVARLADFCAGIEGHPVRYLRPSPPRSMSDHWQWALAQARDQGEFTHFTYLTDRMVFRPGVLRRLVDIAAFHSGRVISYNHDLIDDHRKPVRLHEFRWTGRSVEVDSDYLLSLASRSLHPSCNPRFLNCLVPAPVIDAVETRFGTTFGSISPDFCFAYRCLDLVDAIVYWDRSALVQYAVDRSNGASYSRGIRSRDSADFEALAGARGMNAASPIPEFRTITNAVMNEYCAVRAESGSAKFPEVDMDAYLAAMAVDLEAIEDDAVAAEQLKLLVLHGGTPVHRGAARLADRVRSRPGRVFRQLLMRVFANHLTQPVWAVAGRLGLTPPPSRWFGFESAAAALAWTFRFPRRPSRELRRLAWLTDRAHVRETDLPPASGTPTSRLVETSR